MRLKEIQGSCLQHDGKNRTTLLTGSAPLFLTGAFFFSPLPFSRSVLFYYFGGINSSFPWRCHRCVVLIRTLKQENLADPEADTHAVLLSRRGSGAEAQALGPSSWTSCSHSEAHSFTSSDASEKAGGQNWLSPQFIEASDERSIGNASMRGKAVLLDVANGI